MNCRCGVLGVTRCRKCKKSVCAFHFSLRPEMDTVVAHHDRVVLLPACMPNCAHDFKSPEVRPV